MKHRIVTAVAVLGIIASGCTPETRLDSNRPIQGLPTDMAALPPAQVAEPDSITVFLNVDGFRNVSRMCADGNGIYVTSRGEGASSSVHVVAEDPACAR